MKKGYIFWVLLVFPLLFFLQACKPENDPPVEEPEEPVFLLKGQVHEPGMHRYEYEGFRLDLIVTDTLHNPKGVFMEGEEFLIGFRVTHDFEGLTIRKGSGMFRGLGEVFKSENDTVISIGRSSEYIWCTYSWSIIVWPEGWFVLVPWQGVSQPAGASECWGMNIKALEPLEPGDYFTTLDDKTYFITCAGLKGYIDTLSFRVDFSIIENESPVVSGF